MPRRRDVDGRPSTPTLTFTLTLSLMPPHRRATAPPHRRFARSTLRRSRRRPRQ